VTLKFLNAGANDVLNGWGWDIFSVMDWEAVFFWEVPAEGGIDHDGGVNFVEIFPHLVKWKGVEEPIGLVGDASTDQKTTEEMLGDFAFSLGNSGWNFSGGRDMLVNTDIDNSWFSKDLGLSSDWLNNFPADGSDFDIGDDVGDISNNLVVRPDRVGVGVHVAIDLVQNVPGGELIDKSVAASVDWVVWSVNRGISFQVGGVVVSLTLDWVMALTTLSEDSVPEIPEIDLSVVLGVGLDSTVHIWAHGFNLTSEESAKVISNNWFPLAIDWAFVVLFFIAGSV